jgi:alpha-ketoglutarate-dependent taurine dioxygenase
VSDDLPSALLALEMRGFAILPGLDEEAATRCLGSLGRVIHEFDVRPRMGSRALVTSLRDLPPHTDHHRARWIAWHCVRPAESGGESVLVDARAAYASLTVARRAALERVLLFEHSVFSGDVDRHAVVTRDGMVTRIYYSYWLCDESLAPPEADAFEAFRRAIDHAPQFRRVLRTGDLLLVDNTWMLHGRTAFLDPARHLRRSWLEPR